MMATPNSTIRLHPTSDTMSAPFVLISPASRAKAIAPPAATNWIIRIVPMLKISGSRIVSAAYAPAIEVTVWMPSLNSRYAARYTRMTLNPRISLKVRASPLKATDALRASVSPSAGL